METNASGELGGYDQDNYLHTDALLRKMLVEAHGSPRGADAGRPHGAYLVSWLASWPAEAAASASTPLNVCALALNNIIREAQIIVRRRYS